MHYICTCTHTNNDVIVHVYTSVTVLLGARSLGRQLFLIDAPELKQDMTNVRSLHTAVSRID